MAVAVAHWIIGPSIPRLHKKDEEMSAGARMLKMLVMLMNGGANMIHALAGLVFVVSYYFSPRVKFR